MNTYTEPELEAVRAEARAEALKEAATFDELEKYLIKHSGEWKSEYIQAAIVMLRVIYEERAAILADEPKEERGAEALPKCTTPDQKECHALYNGNCMNGVQCRAEVNRLIEEAGR